MALLLVLGGAALCCLVVSGGAFVYLESRNNTPGTSGPSGPAGQNGPPGPPGPPGQINPYTGTGYAASKYTVDTACITYMSGNDDDTYAPKCYDFVYDHCIEGYQDPSKIPPSIVQNMPSVIKQTIAAANPNSFRNGVMPTQYSRVCVANAAAVNAGHCPQDKVGSYRVHMPGYNLPGYRECDPRHGGTSFVKAHVDNNNKVLTQYVGNVGR